MNFHACPTGSTDFFLEGFHFIPEITQVAKLIPDDYSIHAMKLKPDDSLFVDGSSLCQGNYPEDFSIIIKYQVEQPSTSVTFLNISNEQHGLAITLDLCYDRLNITFGSKCNQSSFSFAISRDKEWHSKWHRFGISISSDSLAVFGDCGEFENELVGYIDGLDLSECRVKPCEEDTTIHIVQPTHTDHCGSDEEVSVPII